MIVRDFKKNVASVLSLERYVGFNKESVENRNTRKGNMMI